MWEKAKANADNQKPIKLYAQKQIKKNLYEISPVLNRIFKKPLVASSNLIHT